MTIKKRLFISNILMLVIPIIVSIVTMLIAAAILLGTIFSGAYEITDSDQLNKARIVLVQLTEELVEKNTESERTAILSKLQNTLDKNNMVIWICENNAEIYRFGNGAVMSNDTLLSAINILGGEGTVSNADSELFARKISENGKEYTVFIYNQKIYASIVNEKARILLIGLFVLGGFACVIYFTNRFLTRFVFRKIEQPLEILSDGVHQISAGNLEHRIVYETEDEFKPICEDFNEMAHQLKISAEKVQKNEQNRKELITGISHDLRSPLTSIKAFVEGLLDNVADTSEKQQEYLQIIKAKTDDINSMVSKLFLFSKMDMGNYPYTPEKLDIGKEISDYVAAASDDYETRGLIIKVSVMPTDKLIYADPVLLRNVFANILDNSAKYKEHETGNVNISCEALTGVIRIVFSDDGPGVSQDALGKLFDIFYRNDPSRSNPQQGSGLGLAIVKKVLDRMGGKVYAESGANGGLAIVLEIPAMEA